MGISEEIYSFKRIKRSRFLKIDIFWFVHIEAKKYPSPKMLVLLQTKYKERRRSSFDVLKFIPFHIQGLQLFGSFFLISSLYIFFQTRVPINVWSKCLDSTDVTIAYSSGIRLCFLFILGYYKCHDVCFPAIIVRGILKVPFNSK